MKTKIILKMAFTLLLLLGLLGLAACTGDDEPTNEILQTEDLTMETTENVGITDNSEDNGEELPQEPTTTAEEPTNNQAAEQPIIVNITNLEEELLARQQIWESLAATERENADRIAEMENRSIPFGEVNMRFEYFVIGEEPADGFPLYIAMHGGGGAPAAVNDQQWQHMQIYYRNSVNVGIYVAVRGVRDTWDTHFNPESFPMYDRLIENMVLLRNVNPNRVYLMGFSAGGDGVYGITPRMADRFAAVSMSAGHHNWINPINFKHTPIILQCGDSDTAFSRHTATVDFAEQLRDLGYTFQLNIHVNQGHNFLDTTMIPQQVWEDPFAWRDGESSEIVFVQANPVYFMDQFTRTPLPTALAWHTGTRADMRAVESFYWLRLPHGESDATIWASYDTAANTITITTEGDLHAPLEILLNRQMVDFDQPVILVVNGETSEHTVESSMEVLRETTAERLDFNFQFTAIIEVEI
ncbi:MAG: dienelactone hydrolase family protein [Defluviitaleaceae bacterium]|nr:dienelactone hydrolase family protein [Defluviitaleaceae bacterium]